MARAYKALPPASELWELFDYKPLTGELVRRRFNRVVTGYQVTVNSYPYLKHRLIWKWVTGIDPAKDIDHRNVSDTDNSWHNLRLATNQQNSCNRKQTKGYTRNQNKWMAQIMKKGKCYNLGRYDTEAEARAAYEEASKRLHGEFSSVV